MEPEPLSIQHRIEDFMESVYGASQVSAIVKDEFQSRVCGATYQTLVEGFQIGYVEATREYLKSKLDGTE